MSQRHRRKRNGPHSPRSAHCTQCGRPVQFCACSSGRHRVRARHSTRTVLHANLICVPSDPPVWRGFVAAVALGIAIVSACGTVVPSDTPQVPTVKTVALTSCMR